MQKVGQQGKRAGDDTAEGMRNAKQETEGLNVSVQNLMQGQMVFNALKQVGSAFGQTLNEAAAYVQRVAEQFIATQKAMQAISAMSGVTNSDKFTLAQVQDAAAANLKPEQMKGFREAFLSAASNYVGSGPNAKLNEEESQKYQLAMAEYSVLHGIEPAAMGDFAGKALAQEKGTTTADAMMAKTGKAYATVEAASASPQHLVPGLTRVMAQGYSLAEAAPALAQLPEIAPDEESTHLLRVIQEVRELGMKGTASQYGITKGMRPAEQLSTLITNLHGRSKEGTDDETLNKLIEGITKEGIAGNTLRGLVKQGPKGLAQWQGIRDRTPEDVVARDIAAGRESDPGVTMRGEAQLALSEAERGARYANVVRLKKEAEAQLAHEGRLRRSALGRGRMAGDQQHAHVQPDAGENPTHPRTGDGSGESAVRTASGRATTHRDRYQREACR